MEDWLRKCLDCYHYYINKMMILKFVVKEQIKVKVVASIVKKNIIIE